MATTPPPAPTRGPATHEGVSRTPSLSCLDKIRLPRPNLYSSDPECNGVTTLVSANPYLIIASRAAGSHQPVPSWA
jgi:hypothetical protein